MKKLVYWIDDLNDRPRSAPEGAVKARFEDAVKAKLFVPEIRNAKEFSAVIAGLQPAQVVGVVMDYQLTHVGERGQMEYGTTWAAQLRGTHASVPVVGISAHRESEIPKFRIENFLAFYPREALLGGGGCTTELADLFRGYRQVWNSLIKKKEALGVDRVVGLLRPPKLVADVVRLAVPEALRHRWDDESPHMASRWIWHQFQGVPGFVCDELEMATHLGLSMRGFTIVRDRFCAARYAGALASELRPRWWIAAIRGIAEKIVGSSLVGPIAHSRELLLASCGVRNREDRRLLSQPHARAQSDQPAECVAYRDQTWTSTERVQALLEDTVVDEADSNPPFGFQARRRFARRDQPCI